MTAAGGRRSATARIVIVRLAAVNDLDAIRRLAVGLLFPDVLACNSFSAADWVCIIPIAQDQFAELGARENLLIRLLRLGYGGEVGTFWRIGWPRDENVGVRSESAIRKLLYSKGLCSIMRYIVAFISALCRTTNYLIAYMLYCVYNYSNYERNTHWSRAGFPSEGETKSGSHR